MKRNSRKGVLAIGVIAGGLAGALIGLLIAPKKGSETRADMKVRTTALRSRAVELASRGRSQAGERASVSIAAVKERAAPIYSGVRERISLYSDRQGRRLTRRVAKGQKETRARAGNGVIRRGDASFRYWQRIQAFHSRTCARSFRCRI